MSRKISMPSTFRGSASRALGDATCKKIARRMVNLPRNILVGISDVMNQGMNLIGIGTQNHHHHQQPPPPQYQPSSFPQIQEEWAFLATFEQQYGANTVHPFFYACRFVDVLKIARDEGKLVFMYLHSPEHPFTHSFCKDTLCNELVVQFLDGNFVSWGGLAGRGDGLQMATTLRASTFPFCAVVAPASGDNLNVLQQLEGPIGAAELVELLQRTMEEHGPAFGYDKGKKEEKRREDRQIREEQDIAYIKSLHMDQEKERLKKHADDHSQQSSKTKHAANRAEVSDRKGEVTQILVRFPNGERREHSFLSRDKIQAIYGYIDDTVPGLGNYRLISNFPRKVYGVDEMGMKLKDAGLHPKASLFLEPL